MRVMHVWSVLVRVRQLLMNVQMGMRLAAWVIRAMTVLVDFVVNVRMGMHLALMDMLVLVPFRRVQPDAECHQGASNHQLCSHRFAVDDHRDRSAEKRSNRKIGRSSRSSKIAQGQDIENKTHTIAQKSNDRCRESRYQIRQRCARPGLLYKGEVRGVE
jgi:hypothetical protein